MVMLYVVKLTDGIIARLINLSYCTLAGFIGVKGPSRCIVDQASQTRNACLLYLKQAEQRAPLSKMMMINPRKL